MATIEDTLRDAYKRGLISDKQLRSSLEAEKRAGRLNKVVSNSYKYVGTSDGGEGTSKYTVGVQEPQQILSSFLQKPGQVLDGVSSKGLLVTLGGVFLFNLIFD